MKHFFCETIATRYKIKNKSKQISFEIIPDFFLFFFSLMVIVLLVLFFSHRFVLNANELQILMKLQKCLQSHQRPTTSKYKIVKSNTKVHK